MIPIRIFLLAALIVAASAQVNTAVSCSTLNPFLNKLVYNGIRYEYLTSTTSPICGGMWAREGTCCSPEAAMTFSIDEQLKVERDISLFNQYLTGLQTKTKDYLNNEKLQYGTNLQAFISLLDDPYLGFLKRLLDDRVVENLKINTAKCWWHMQVVRNSSLCSICTGQSPKYFSFLYGKGFVDLDTCNTVMSNCSEFFVEILHFVKGAARLGKLVEYIDAQRLQENRWVNRLFYVIDATRDLMPLIDRYNNSLSATTQERQIAQILLFNRFMRFYERVVLYRLKFKLEIILVFFSTVVSDYKQHKQSMTARLLFGKNSNWRSLQTASTESVWNLNTGIGSAETMVLFNSENYLTTTPDLQQVVHYQLGKETMNLTLAFS